MVSPTKRKSLHHSVSRNERSRPWKSERTPQLGQADCLPIQKKTRPLPLDQYRKRRRTHDESQKVLAPRSPPPAPRTPSPIPRTPSPAPVVEPDAPKTSLPVPIGGTPKRQRPLTPRVTLSPSDYVENIPPKSFRSLMTQTVPTLCDFGTQTDPVPSPKPLANY
ncbi:PREDICTED: max-binding protein MNT-like [Vollenhovia emeryi]|uniref:max-binding protein MNT-like n=1 Tax=Vollenhovia emeryi TaxID=411798 RepID=UPI0005F3EF19|nr:PREDICTED: max-binding protein MNT-like [Vollenhovia emeryi]